jgi:hypothetical protein
MQFSYLSHANYVSKSLHCKKYLHNEYRKASKEKNGAPTKSSIHVPHSYGPALHVQLLTLTARAIPQQQFDSLQTCIPQK